jgi:hypothetical protein
MWKSSVKNMCVSGGLQLAGCVLLNLFDLQGMITVYIYIAAIIWQEIWGMHAMIFGCEKKLNQPFQGNGVLGGLYPALANMYYRVTCA